MTEHEFELRLLAAARALDAEAPAFDPSVLPKRPSPIRFAVVAFAIAAALAAVAAAPAAVSALRDLFEVESVPELGPVAADVAPAFLGRPSSPDEARAAVPFQVRTIPALGAPDAAYVRDDIVGEMVTLAFEDGTVVLTQWRASDVRARISIVPVQGTAEDVEIGARHGLWTAGEARGTLTLVGADRAVHRELFDVAQGALLWQEDGVTFLLQGAGSKENAVRLAAQAR